MPGDVYPGIVRLVEGQNCGSYLLIVLVGLMVQPTRLFFFSHLSVLLQTFGQKEKNHVMGNAHRVSIPLP